MRFAAIVALLAAALAPAADKTAPSPLGRTIDAFSLPDAAGKEWTLAAVKESKAVVVAFVGTECPVNNLYLPRLAELAKEYRAKGVAFVAVNSNEQDDIGRVAEHARNANLPFPVLKDKDAAVADRFAARRTPEVFVLDAARKIVYRGRVDDQYGVGFSRSKPTRRDLVCALDEILEGKTVSVAETEAPGCLIARPAKVTKASAVTYTRDVSRLVQTHCQECHRPGQIGPMALTTYGAVKAWSATIKEVVEEKRMPPWHADPRHGRFRNDRSLSKEERETLLSWIDAGCPKGDEKDLPTPKSFADGWRIGTPDAVFTMPTAFKVPATAPRGGVPYKYFTVATNFAEDRWVQAAEAKPGARAVVHHIIVYTTGPNGTPPERGPDGIGHGFLAPYAPGDMPAIFPPGAAKKVPKGAVLVFQMHYTPNGVEQEDQSSVGLIFAKEPPKYEMRTRSIASRNLNIPAGADNHEVISRSTFPQDIVLYNLLPHMHLRGKDFTYKVTYPDGKSEVLLAVPRYEFGWQTSYRLAEPLRLPAGTRIECTAHFDNSTKNPNNPDPTKLVRWGEQTWEEMMIGFVDYAVAPK